MTPRYITFDSFGRIYEVSDLFDQFANPTTDPILAASCIIKVEDQWLPQQADDVPIYVVH